MKKSIKDEIDKDLNDLVASSLATNDDEFPENEIDPIPSLDIEEVDTIALQKAQNVVISCLKLYFDENIISNNDYIAAKAAVATSTIKTLFGQLKRAEHMVDKIINDIDLGNMQPRIFEVATTIQSSIRDILKDTQIHVISLQEDLKRVKHELPQDIIEVKEELPKGNNTYLTGKNLLKDLEKEDE